MRIRDLESDPFWAAVPQRLLEWRETDDGRCVILRPKFGVGRIGRWLGARVGEPHYRIRLDELGTFVWKSCDGERSLAAIAVRLRDHFGPSVEPAEQRVGLFVRKMIRSKVVKLSEPPSRS